jgi:hypothetical protein
VVALPVRYLAASRSARRTYGGVSDGMICSPGAEDRRRSQRHLVTVRHSGPLGWDPAQQDWRRRGHRAGYRRAPGVGLSRRGGRRRSPRTGILPPLRVVPRAVARARPAVPIRPRSRLGATAEPRTGTGRRPLGCTVRCPAGAGVDPTAPSPRWMRSRLARRHATDLARRGHHQLPDAGARPAMHAFDRDRSSVCWSYAALSRGAAGHSTVSSGCSTPRTW